MAQNVRIVDLDTYEPTDAEIVSCYGMMTAPDQLFWQYDDSWARTPTTPQQEVRGFRERRDAQRGANHAFWAIVDGEVVGMIGVNRFEGPARSHCAEIGYGVAAAYTRQGIASRLLGAAIRKARAIGLERLEADCFEENAASVALLRKFGFGEEGVRVGAIRKEDRLRNTRLFGLFLSEGNGGGDG